MNKIDSLYKYLEDLGEICIGFSGGVDSTFLSLVSYKVLNKKALLVTASSPFITEDELSFAKEFANKLGIKHEIVEIELDDIVLKNTKDRCYYCKFKTFSEIIKKADNNGIKYIADGANIDDIGDYRPGTKATKELGIISPLKELGFSKSDIRANLEILIKENSLLSGYDIYKKPAMACLASRVPYGTIITNEILLMVGQAEKFIKSKLKIEELRVRYHNAIARIEVKPKDFNKLLDKADIIIKELKCLGFKYITMDIEGIRQGSLNEVLDINKIEGENKCNI